MANPGVADEWKRHPPAEPRASDSQPGPGRLDAFLSGADILDIAHDAPPAAGRKIRPHAIGVDLLYPGYDGKTLPFANDSQDAVFVSHTLEHLADYRTALADWFRVLRVGGHLVVTVPHQFLYERKLTPPSRWNETHKRFYTAASLLAEIEDSLDPMSYRVRWVEENDDGFDYHIPPDQHATGACHVVAAIERIDRPAYADAVMDRTISGPDSGGYLQVHRIDQPEPILAIESDSALPQRVVAIKLDHRGDFILAKPGFAALRAQFPQAAMTLICGPWNRDAAHALGLFDDIVTVDFFPEVSSHAHEKSSDADQRRARAAAQDRFEQAIAGRSWDIAVDLRVDQDTRPLLAKIDATHRAGFGATEDFPFLDIALPFINPTAAGRAYRRVLKADQFSTHIGTHEGFAIVHPGSLRPYKPGAGLIYGPYATFEAGRWDMEMIIEPLKERFEIAYDVCADGGNDIFAYGLLSVGGATYPRFTIQLEEPTRGVEIRLWTHAAGRVAPFRFLGIRAVKTGSFSALHQQEMLALLAHLVGLRMRNPFSTRDLPA
jgi:hypothetical protein